MIDRTITLSERNEGWFVTIHYTEDDDISEVENFELKRLESLQDRGLRIPSSQARYWDSKRKITVKIQ